MTSFYINQVDLLQKQNNNLQKQFDKNKKKIDEIKNNPMYKLKDYLLEKVQEKYIVDIILNNINNLYKLEFDEYQKDPENNTISENCIRMFQDEVDWEYIIKYQNLSKYFIWEFRDKIKSLCFIDKFWGFNKAMLKHFFDKRKIEYQPNMIKREMIDLIKKYYIKIILNKINNLPPEKNSIYEDFIREFQFEVTHQFWGFNKTMLKNFLNSRKIEYQSNMLKKDMIDLIQKYYLSL